MRACFSITAERAGVKNDDVRAWDPVEFVPVLFLKGSTAYHEGPMPWVFRMFHAFLFHEDGLP